jgi:hypothetical protein
LSDVVLLYIENDLVVEVLELAELNKVEASKRCLVCVKVNDQFAQRCLDQN